MTIDQDGSVVMCNGAVSCQVDAHMCHIVTAKFGKYCLVGESAPQCSAVKSLRLAAFARNLTNAPDHNVRVYAIEDHPDALDVSDICTSTYTYEYIQYACPLTP